MFTSALKMFLNSSAVTAVTDAYFNLVTLLLPGNGTNGAQNNTFLDSSTNNFTITRNGNTTQGTFSPFSQTGWSYFGSATTDKLTASSTSPANFGSSAFTVEAWVYFNDIGTTRVVASNYQSSTVGWAIYRNTSNFVTFHGSGDGADITSTTAVVVGRWYHIAVSGTPTSPGIRLFINGVQEGSTYTGAVSLDSTNAVVVGDGAGGAGGAGINGYISNLRLLKGTALYTTNFTPPTSPLTAITNTSLLACQSNRFVDNSSNGYTFTVGGSPSVQAFSPFAPAAAYSTDTVGGSGYFDGSGDYLTNATAAVTDFGTSAYTWEAWIYFTGASQTGEYEIYEATNASGAFQVYVAGSSGGLRWGAYGVGGLGPIFTAGNIPTNQWFHLAVCRVNTSTNQTFAFVNGVLTVTTTDTNNYTQAGVSIGARKTGVNFYTGYLSNIRVVKGSAVYTGAFTPPTAPLTNIANTSLLLNFTNAGITDSTAKNVLETLGNASISTTQSKFGGSSMFFDGSGDYLSATPKIQSNSVQSGNATIEMWVYTSNSSSSLKCLVDTRSAQNTNTGFGIYQIANNVVIYGAGVKGNAAGQLTGNTWVHLAVTRANTTNYVFIGGTLYNTFSYGNTLTSSNVTIGSDVVGSNAFTGYIDDLRITNGLARYTANFTPTTTAFPVQ